MKEDTTIEKYQFYDHLPTNSSQLNTSDGVITIIINDEDIKTEPHSSLLVISGQLIVKDKDNKSIDIDNKKVRFVNNGILHMFSKISYFINSVEVDSILSPGISTSIKALSSFSDKVELDESGWNINFNKKGYFNIIIPMYNIMGFFEDNRKYLFRISQRLELIKSGNITNCLLIDESMNTNYTFNIELSEIIWRMRHIKFSVEVETDINQKIASNMNFPLHFRNWKYFSNVGIPAVNEYTWRITTTSSKPRYFLIAFQNNKTSNLLKDNSKYDFCNLENVQVQLNTCSYPNSNLKLSYSENKCKSLYHMFQDFKKSYFYKSKENISSIIDYNEFLNKYPIIIIDTSKQNEVIKQSVIDIKIDFKWRELFPANTIIHCLIISDDSYSYNPLSNIITHTQV